MNDRHNDQIHDQIREQLSAYMDGELSEAERPLLAKRLDNDPELRATWSRYHMVRDVLDNHAPMAGGLDISARVRAALSAEPAHHAAPRKAAWKPLAGAAIAASVALMAILGVQRLGTLTAPEITAVAAAPTPTADDYQRVAGARWDLAQPELEDNLNQYLLSHKRHAADSGMPGMVPYVRIVGYDTSE